MTRFPLFSNLNPLARKQFDLTYLLDVGFSTDDVAPLTNPYVGEIGSLVPVEVDGSLAASSGILSFGQQSTPNYGDEGYYSVTSFARVIGRAVMFEFIRTGGASNKDLLLGWQSAADVSLANLRHGLYITATNYTPYTNGGASSPVITTGFLFLDGYSYKISIVLRSSGAFIFMRGGPFIDWTLIWSEKNVTLTPLYAAIDVYNAIATQDFVRVFDLPNPFTDDYGIASFNITSSSLSAGSDVIVDGAFTTVTGWTADNPNGWTVTETAPDPEVTERAPANGHADVVGAGGAANFFSSVTDVRPKILKANVLNSVGVWMIEVNTTKFVAGSVQIQVGANTQETYNSAVNRRTYVGIVSTVSPANDVQFFGRTGANVTLDNITAKKLTLDTAQVMTADSILTFEFTLPVSPIAGQELGFCYRINAAGEELYNCWYAYIKRNATNSAWDAKLDSIASGARTNRASATGVSSPDTLRVICHGDAHQMYTAAASVFTLRGAAVVNSLYNAATGANTVYDPATTYGLFVSYPRRNRNYDVLQIARRKTNVNYLLQDEFLTDVAASLSSSRSCEPGPGLLKKATDSTNLVSIVSSKLDFFSNAGAVPVNFIDPSYYFTDSNGNGFARTAGRAMATQLEVKTNGSRPFMMGWSNNISPASTRTILGIYFPAGSVMTPAVGSLPGIGSTWTIGIYNFIFVTLATGGLIFGKGGILGTTWQLLWSEYFNDATATLYPMIQGVSAIDFEVDSVKVSDLVSPFNGDHLLDSFNVTGFTQSLGSEKMTDTGIEAWTTSTNATSYTETIAGSSTVNQETSVIHGGSNAARIDIDSSNNAASIKQAITSSIGDILELGTWAKNSTTSKTFGINVESSGGAPHTLTTSYQNFKEIRRVLDTNPNIQYQRVTATSSSIYYDDVSAKKITINAAQVMATDAIIDLEFTLPVSPLPGQEVHSLYRINASGEELLNCWDAYLKRSDDNAQWNFNLDSIASGTRTSRIATTNVGNVIHIRVICFGNLHDCYTRVGTTWTKQGAQVNNSTYATATGANNICESNFTCTRFSSTPRTPTAAQQAILENL